MKIDLEVRPMALNAMAKRTAADEGSGYAMDIDPEDIQVSDTVTVVWEIV